MTASRDDHEGFAVDTALSSVEGDFFRALLANTSDGLLTINRESTIIFANAALEDILGYAPEELVGSSKLEIIPERLQPVHLEQLHRYLETGTKNLDWDGVELPAQHKDGHEVTVEITLREHEFDGKRLFTGIFRDISERKRQERMLRKQNTRLEHFGSVLSHDLRNPLNVAQAYTQELADQTDRPEVDEVTRSLERIEHLITDVLTLAQDGVAVEDLEPISIEKVAVESWEWVQTADAELLVETDVGTVEADRSRVCSLLENLFRNAVEHGGPAVSVTVGRLNDGLGFYVADDGVGIPADKHETAFDYGYTTNTDGTGLGLAIVDRIATAHGWEVRIDESAAGGARFEFRV